MCVIKPHYINKFTQQKQKKTIVIKFKYVTLLFFIYKTLSFPWVRLYPEQIPQKNAFEAPCGLDESWI